MDLHWFFLRKPQLCHKAIRVDGSKVECIIFSFGGRLSGCLLFLTFPKDCTIVEKNNFARNGLAMIKLVCGILTVSIAADNDI